MANHVLLVTQLDLPCLRNVVRLMMSFGQMDAIKDKVKIVVNRVGLDNHISLKKAQETIGREIFWQLPNDYRVMVEVRNNGVPLIEQAPKAAITQSIIALADALCGNGEPQAEAPRPRPKRPRSASCSNLWPGRARSGERQVAAAVVGLPTRVASGRNRLSSTHPRGDHRLRPDIRHIRHRRHARFLGFPCQGE